MKKVALIVLSFFMAAPAFAGDVVGHSVAVAGKDSGKAAVVAGKSAAVAGKDTAKGTVKAVKFIF